MESPWTPLVQACERFLDQRGKIEDIRGVGQLLHAIEPHLSRLQLNKEDLPYGRYLLHHDAADRFNIQLDIFSMDYAGAVHTHETWGMLWTLKGRLFVSDWDVPQDGEPILFRDGILRRNSGNCFYPPHDWHRVISPADGPQPVSVHIYGEGFNLDKGIYLDDAGKPQRSSRSDFGSNDVFLPFLSYEG